MNQRNVLDTCFVRRSVVTKSSGTTDKNNKSRGWGTRVFRYKDVNYCEPYYEYDDEQWAVFVCFPDSNDLIKQTEKYSNAEKVKEILKKNPKDKDIFLKNEELATLGGFYSLNVFDNFGKLIDTVDAVYYANTKLSQLTKTKLNGIDWTPSAEILSAMAVYGSSVYPAGSLVAVDNPDSYPDRRPRIGFPNVAETNPELLEKIREKERPPFGKWIEMTAHVHPYGDFVDSHANNSSECPNRDNDIFTGIWKNSGNEHRFDLSNGPSKADLRTQHKWENDTDKKYKSVVIDRHFIWLYSCHEPNSSEFKTNWDMKEMAIKRRQPNTTHDPTNKK